MAFVAISFIIVVLALCCFFRFGPFFIFIFFQRHAEIFRLFSTIIYIKKQQNKETQIFTLESFQSNNAAKISSLFGLLLEPLDGGVFKFGGSKYDNSSIGSTTLSGKSCMEKKKITI